MLWLLMACNEPSRELLSFTFSRYDCVHSCIGEQPVEVPAEYWGELDEARMEDNPNSFSYAGMRLRAERWDYFGAEALKDDPMWYVKDPACDLADVGEMDSWPACPEPLPAYPPSEECY